MTFKASLATAISEVVKEAQKLFTEDYGITCSIRVGPVANNEHAKDTIWLSDWFVPRSPVWRERPTHMLKIRAQEKVLTMCIGTGLSAIPSEQDVE